jgi:hypothetical protein
MIFLSGWNTKSGQRIRAIIYSAVNYSANNKNELATLISSIILFILLIESVFFCCGIYTRERSKHEEDKEPNNNNRWRSVKSTELNASIHSPCLLWQCLLRQHHQCLAGARGPEVVWEKNCAYNRNSNKCPWLPTQLMRLMTMSTSSGIVILMSGSRELLLKLP